MPVILITETSSKWENIFNKRIIFKTLTDEHILRILFMQKIKLAKEINEYVTIYLDNIELEEFNIHSKLYKILKYEADDYMIKLIDIENGYNQEEIEEYNKNFQ
tara:strand:- start:131 stop:442 length:312 start_codon:yes stop_codon:yes gene_type:complete